MCKTEYADGGAQLHHPTQDSVNPLISVCENLMILEKSFCGLLPQYARYNNTLPIKSTNNSLIMT